MGLEFSFGFLDVKWQRRKVGYLREKSMVTMKTNGFLPQKHWILLDQCLVNYDFLSIFLLSGGLEHDKMAGGFGFV